MKQVRFFRKNNNNNKKREESHAAACRALKNNATLFKAKRSSHDVGALLQLGCSLELQRKARLVRTAGLKNHGFLLEMLRSSLASITLGRHVKLLAGPIRRYF